MEISQDLSRLMLRDLTPKEIVIALYKKGDSESILDFLSLTIEEIVTTKKHKEVTNSYLNLDELVDKFKRCKDDRFSIEVFNRSPYVEATTNSKKSRRVNAPSKTDTVKGLLASYSKSQILMMPCYTFKYKPSTPVLPPVSKPVVKIEKKVTMDSKELQAKRDKIKKLAKLTKKQRLRKKKGYDTDSDDDSCCENTKKMWVKRTPIVLPKKSMHEILNESMKIIDKPLNNGSVKNEENESQKKIEDIVKNDSEKERGKANTSVIAKNDDDDTSDKDEAKIKFPVDSKSCENINYLKGNEEEKFELNAIEVNKSQNDKNKIENKFHKDNLTDDDVSDIEDLEIGANDANFDFATELKNTGNLSTDNDSEILSKLINPPTSCHQNNDVENIPTNISLNDNKSDSSFPFDSTDDFWEADQITQKDNNKKYEIFMKRFCIIQTIETDSESCSQSQATFGGKDNNLKQSEQLCSSSEGNDQYDNEGNIPTNSISHESPLLENNETVNPINNLENETEDSTNIKENATSLNDIQLNSLSSLTSSDPKNNSDLLSNSDRVSDEGGGSPVINPIKDFEDNIPSESNNDDALCSTEDFWGDSLNDPEYKIQISCAIEEAIVNEKLNSECEGNETSSPANNFWGEDVTEGDDDKNKQNFLEKHIPFDHTIDGEGPQSTKSSCEPVENFWGATNEGSSSLVLEDNIMKKEEHQYEDNYEKINELSENNLVPKSSDTFHKTEDFWGDSETSDKVINNVDCESSKEEKFELDSEVDHVVCESIEEKNSEFKSETDPENKECEIVQEEKLWFESEVEPETAACGIIKDEKSESEALPVNPVYENIKKEEKPWFECDVDPENEVCESSKEEKFCFENEVDLETAVCKIVKEEVVDCENEVNPVNAVCEVAKEEKLLFECDVDPGNEVSESTKEENVGCEKKADIKPVVYETNKEDDLKIGDEAINANCNKINEEDNNDEYDSDSSREMDCVIREREREIEKAKEEECDKAKESLITDKNNNSQSSKDKGVNKVYTDKTWDPLLLWFRPLRCCLDYLATELNSMKISKITSVGCGTGLLEWLIWKETGITVTGYEVNRSWWSSEYSPPLFLPHIYVDEVSDTFHVVPRSHALLFCYFNDGQVFKQYLRKYGGPLIIIIGPINGMLHTDPLPLDLVDSPQWILKSVHQQQCGNLAAFYVRRQKKDQVVKIIK